MAETLESIKQEIAKIAAEKADLKGIVDQQKETIVRQETTIGNLQEALKAAETYLEDRVKKLQKELDHYKKYADEEHTHKVRAWDSNGVLGKENEQLQKRIDEFKEALDREATENVKLIKEVGTLTELKEDLKAELKNEVARLSKLLDTAYAGIANRDEYIKELEETDVEEEIDGEEEENLNSKINHLKAVIENRDEYIQELESDRSDLNREIDVLNGNIEELKANGDPGMIAALAAKDEELRKLGEKVPAKDREINDLKAQVRSKNQDLAQSYKELNRSETEKEHLANAIENAYRSLMITRGYQLPDESGVSNG